MTVVLSLYYTRALNCAIVRPSVVLKQIGSGKNHRVLENQCYSYAGGLGLGLHITGTLSLEVCGHYLIDVTALTTMCCCN